MIARRGALLIPLVVVACRTQSIPVHDVAAISPASGAVSAKLLPDPNAPELLLGPGEEFTAPQLVPGNPPPVYPPELVSLHLPPHSVVLRVLFDERGGVYDVAKSPVAAPTEDQYRPVFEAASEAALRQWKCWPPTIRKFRNGPDAGGDGKPDYRILAAHWEFKTFFDVSFSFEVVNGQPVVRGGRGEIGIAMARKVDDQSRGSRFEGRDLREEAGRLRA